MNKFIGILLALTLVSLAIAQTDTKTYVETDRCIPIQEAIDGVVSVIPDATNKIFNNTVIFSSPTREGNLVTYFDENGCYVAFEVVGASNA